MKSVFLFFSCSFLVSCTLTGNWHNEEIDPGLKSEMDSLNDVLYTSILTNDLATFKSLCSDTLISISRDQLDSIVSEMSRLLTPDGHQVIDQYYIHNISGGTFNSSLLREVGDDGYTLAFQTISEESYVALMLPVNSSNEILITAIYGKYDDQWLLNSLQFGQYSLAKKTATDYYDLAKSSFDQGYLVDAKLYIDLAISCIKPANDYLTYKKDGDIRDLKKRIERKLKTDLSFPYSLADIASGPSIFNIGNQQTTEGIFPMVHYTTSIPIGDTLRLKAENDSLRPLVAELFPGLDKDKRYLFYRVYNEIPGGVDTVKHYGFVQEFKQ